MNIIKLLLYSMETKFVKSFLEPHEVICRDRLVNYGFCFGARKFHNGSFALRLLDGVTLYDAHGYQLEVLLDDVFVFKNGYRLQKSVSSELWSLLQPDGQIVLTGEKVDVCDEHLLAVRTAEREWRLYQFSENDAKLLFLTECFADNLRLFKNHGNDYFVVAFMEPDGVILQLRHETLGVVSTELPMVRSCFPLFDGRFIVSDAHLSIKEHDAGCILVEVALGEQMALYDDKLQLQAQNVLGLALFRNDMYLLNENDEWKLFSAKGKVLRDKIYHLTIYDAQNLKQCLLFAGTENDERVVIRLKDNGWLHVTYGKELRFWTPDGDSVVAEDGCNDPILI